MIEVITMKRFILVGTLITMLVLSVTGCGSPKITEPDEPSEKTPAAIIHNYYEVTEDEREMLAKIVTLEASICSVDTQKDVCSVIFNRLDSGKWNKDMNGDNKITLYDIIYYPYAFSPVLAGKMDECIPTAEAYIAVDYVIVNGPTVPTYVRYFRAGRHFTEWYDEGYTGYSIKDNVYFGYFTNWEQGAW